jgi:bifunctional non-homologous end joining protein LigD
MSRRKIPAKKAAAPLDEYRAKRDFKRTPEPGADLSSHTGRSFVVQEHDARSHHFDFRLEIDGVLVSWALPKGLPEDPQVKRLAVHVEDHPLEYGRFEGEIPKGNYGAGTVSIWDQGEWEPSGKNWENFLAKGKLKFFLKGRRLQGAFLLARMGEEPNWIMRKVEEDLPRGEAERERARFVSPQLARILPSVPAGKDWLHEIKFDGYRLIAVKNEGDVRIFTRNQIDWTDRFRSLADQLKKISEHDFVLDGEAVVFDDQGRSRFGMLQSALQSGDAEKIRFIAFDLLHLNGSSLRSLPLVERMDELAKLLGDQLAPVFRSKVWPSEKGIDLFQQACAMGLEGIVSKNLKGRYLEGARRDWVKSKCRARQEFLVCGYTAPKGSLAGFGALVLASYENGDLVPRGKVGSGFSDMERMKLMDQFRPLHTARAPIHVIDPTVQWLEPRLVAEVEFAELTTEGAIRQGSFVGLREDKRAEDVHLESLHGASAGDREQKVAGIAISHPARLVYPGDQISKLELARYYETVSELMLPFVAQRPLALLRAPTGITGEIFFQKSFPSHIPEGVYQELLADHTSVVYVKDAKGIVSLVQFGVIEFHPWGASRSRPERPDFLTWDLDPDESVPWVEVLGAAFLLRDFLADMGLSTAVKTSGGKGLHIMMHVKRTHDWDVMKRFTKAVADNVAKYNLKRFTTTSRKSKRSGKIYIDWMRNGRGATCIAPWCVRARPGAAVSMPLNWADLHAIQADQFTIHHPPLTPSEWMAMKPQSVTKAALRRVGVE